MKFNNRPQTNGKQTSYAENTSDIKKMPTVLDTTICTKHQAVRGQACFSFPSMSGSYLHGICNKRALKAGFNAPISPEALRAGFQKRKLFRGK